MELNWSPAPVSTQWGAGMMVADVALDKDSTVTLYAHADDLHKVAAALAKLTESASAVVSHFHLTLPDDRRTQQQLAAAASRSTQRRLG